MYGLLEEGCFAKRAADEEEELEASMLVPMAVDKFADEGSDCREEGDPFVGSSMAAAKAFLFDFPERFFLKIKPSTFCLPGAVALRTMLRSGCTPLTLFPLFPPEKSKVKS